MAHQQETFLGSGAQFFQQRLERASRRELFLDFQAPFERQVMLHQLRRLLRAGQGRTEQRFKVDVQLLHSPNGEDHLFPPLFGQRTLLFGETLAAAFDGGSVSQEI
ncbi:MAG: hypothetical protein K8R69_06240 [Deltaproteobacteria bacterium]|nr:hypothetical protein [Deltaproteobacteria bacterium]